MVILEILFIIFFIVFAFGEGTVTVNDVRVTGIYKIIGSFIGAIVFALILGLPLLGIISLF